MSTAVGDLVVRLLGDESSLADTLRSATGHVLSFGQQVAGAVKFAGLSAASTAVSQLSSGLQGMGVKVSETLPILGTLGSWLKIAAGATLALTVATKTWAGVSIASTAAMEAYKTALAAASLAMEMYRAGATKAAAAAMFLQLMASPIGWIKVGAAIAVGVASMVALNAAMGSTAEASRPAASALDQVGAASPGVDRVAKSVSNLGDNAAEARRKLDGLKESLGVFTLSGAESYSQAEQLGQALQSLGIDVFGRNQALPPMYTAVVTQMESLVEHFGSASAAASAYSRAIDQTLSPLERYQQKLADIGVMAELIGEKAADALRADALAEYDQALGGPQAKFREMADELQRMRAGVDEQEWQFRKWEQAGVAGVDGMRQMREEMERLEAEDKKAKEPKEKAPGRDSASPFAAAAEKGSREAYSMIYAAMGAGQKDELQKEGNRKLDRIANGVEELARRADEPGLDIPA